jgi:hypothetical protein
MYGESQVISPSGRSLAPFFLAGFGFPDTPRAVIINSTRIVPPSFFRISVGYVFTSPENAKEHQDDDDQRKGYG